MDLKSTTSNSTAPNPIAGPGEPTLDQIRGDLSRNQASASPRQKPVVSSIDELDDSFDGDEAVLQDNSGASMLKFMDGQWKQFHGSLSGMKIENGSDGIPALKISVGGKTYRLPFIEEA